MTKLDKKYIDDTLTIKQLEELRQLNASRTDLQIEEVLRESWETEPEGSVSVSHDQLARIKGRIDSAILDKSDNNDSVAEIMELPTPRKFTKYLKWIGRAAAAIMLPLLVISTIYLYHQNNQLQAKNFIASTGAGERVTITLPDNTKVMLNSNSTLQYSLANFNKQEREVQFDGEGYFVVAKDPEKQFLVESDGLQVAVLGTTFNLESRASNSIAELDLEEGKVRFTSTSSGESVIVMPNQIATLDKTSGEISLTTTEDLNDNSAWTRAELVFRNAPLTEVFNEMGKAYSVQIEIDESDAPLLEDRFTGTLSASNINDAFEVLEHTYHRKVLYLNGKVIFEKN